MSFELLEISSLDWELLDLKNKINWDWLFCDNFL